MATRPSSDTRSSSAGTTLRLSACSGQLRFRLDLHSRRSRGHVHAGAARQASRVGEHARDRRTARGRRRESPNRRPRRTSCFRVQGRASRVVHGLRIDDRGPQGSRQRKAPPSARHALVRGRTHASDHVRQPLESAARAHIRTREGVRPSNRARRRQEPNCSAAADGERPSLASPERSGSRSGAR